MISSSEGPHLRSRIAEVLRPRSVIEVLDLSVALARLEALPAIAAGAVAGVVAGMVAAHMHEGPPQSFFGLIAEPGLYFGMLVGASEALLIPMFMGRLLPGGAAAGAWHQTLVRRGQLLLWGMLRVWASVVLAVAGVIPGLLFFAWTAVLGGVMWYEQAGWRDAFARIVALNRGRMWRSLAVVLVNWMLFYLAGISVTVFELTFGVSLGEMTVQVCRLVLTSALIPLTVSAGVALYVDARVDHDGLDVTHLLDGLEGQPMEDPPSGALGHERDTARLSRSPHWR